MLILFGLYGRESKVDAMKAKRVLLLGGTGAMSRNLSTILAKQGFEVFVTSRRYQNDSQGIKYLQRNAHDKAFLAHVLEIPWSAIVDFMLYGDTEEFRERVDLLLSATAQYVFFRSSRVYADSRESITEKSHRLLDVSNDRKGSTPVLEALRKEFTKFLEAPDFLDMYNVELAAENDRIAGEFKPLSELRRGGALWLTTFPIVA